MSPDLQLDLLARPCIKPDVGELERILVERSDWLKAYEIEHLTGWTDRSIRQLAAASGGRILSGQRGYRHLLHSDPEEIQHASQWLISQGREMIRRGIAIRRCGHMALAVPNSMLRVPRSP